MARLDKVKDVDLARRAEELAQEAERLRESDGRKRGGDSRENADERLSASIRTLRKLAEK